MSEPFGRVWDEFRVRRSEKGSKSFKLSNITEITVISREALFYTLDHGGVKTGTHATNTQQQEE